MLYLHLKLALVTFESIQTAFKCQFWRNREMQDGRCEDQRLDV